MGDTCSLTAQEKSHNPLAYTLTTDQIKRLRESHQRSRTDKADEQVKAHWPGMLVARGYACQISDHKADMVNGE